MSSDQHFLRLFYGNEDKSEQTDLMYFGSPQSAANYLRQLADKIEEFKDSKDYRGSDRWLFEELAHLEEKMDIPCV